MGSDYLTSLVLTLSVAVSGVQAVQAQDAAFQDFFFNICQGNPTGGLADRCAETPGAAGDLSGDSEASLNPGQPLSFNDRTLARSRSQAREVQKRVEQLQNKDAAESTPEQSDEQQAVYGPWSVFINGRGSWFDRDRGEDDEERSFDGHTAGLQAGVDYRLFERAVVGFMFSYDDTSIDFDTDQPGVNFVPASNEGETDADSYSFILYGTYKFTDRFFFDGGISYGFTDYTFTRNVVFQETNRGVPQTNVVTEADSDGHEFWVSGGVRYDFYHGAFRFGPYVRANYARSEINGYTESDLTNSGLQMSFDESTRESLTSVVGVRGSYSISTRWGVLLPQIRAEYEHQFDKNALTQTAAFALDGAGNLFSLTGDDPDRDYANLGATLAAALPHGLFPFLDFQALVGYQDLDRYQLTAGLRVEF